MTELGPQIRRAGSGRFVLRLEPHERRILASLVAELRAELANPGSAVAGGALARLYPPAFPDDPEAEAAYADLVHSDLVDTRRDRVAIVEATLEAHELDDPEAAAWLGTLNDLRLVLGSQLDLDIENADDGDGDHGDEGDPGADAMRRAVFDYLGWLVASFTDALANGLPVVPDEVEPRPRE